MVERTRAKGDEGESPSRLLYLRCILKPLDNVRGLVEMAGTAPVLSPAYAPILRSFV